MFSHFRVFCVFAFSVFSRFRVFAFSCFHMFNPGVLAFSYFRVFVLSHVQSWRFRVFLFSRFAGGIRVAETQISYAQSFKDTKSSVKSQFSQVIDQSSHSSVKY